MLKSNVEYLGNKIEREAIDSSVEMFVGICFQQYFEERKNERIYGWSNKGKKWDSISIGEEPSRLQGCLISGLIKMGVSEELISKKIQEKNEFFIAKYGLDPKKFKDDLSKNINGMLHVFVPKELASKWYNKGQTSP